MITSKYGFCDRFIRRRCGQRLELTILGRTLPETFWDDYGITGPDALVTVNGILVTCWRPSDPVPGSWQERPRPLHRMELELRDTLVNGRPFFIPRRRRSRKERGGGAKRFNGMRIALDEVIWPAVPQGNAGRARGFANGIAGFLATGLPAPGTPPDEKKADGGGDTSTRSAATRPATLEARALETRSQGDPQTIETAARRLARWYKQAQRRARTGYLAADEARAVATITVLLRRRELGFNELMRRTAARMVTDVSSLYPAAMARSVP
jgi:hypothetical protein